MSYLLLQQTVVMEMDPQGGGYADQIVSCPTYIQQCTHHVWSVEHIRIMNDKLFSELHRRPDPRTNDDSYSDSGVGIGIVCI